MTDKEQAKIYFAHIDGLRALAVISVIIYHSSPNRLSGGFTGVDIFFVISGYLITGILLRNVKDSKYGLFQFYRKRVRRIFPALIIVLLSTLSFGFFVLLPEELHQIGFEITSGALFFSNFYFMNNGSYFDVDALSKPLLHLWSLGVEEQFYIFWPLILYAIIKTKKMGRILILLLISSFCLNIYISRNDLNLAFFSPFTRFWELMLGALAIFAHTYYIKFFNRNALSNILSIAGTTLIFFGLFCIQRTEFPGPYSLIPATGAFLIILSGPKSLISQYFLSNRVPVFVGLISYPLYLWHYPILSFLHILWSGDGPPTLTARFLAILLSFILAYLTYLLIEKPCRKADLRFTSNLLIAFMILILSLGVLTSRTAFATSHISVIPNTAESILGKYPHVQKNHNCKNLYPNQFDIFWSCLLSKNKLASIALIGDSHANQYFASLAKVVGNESLISLAEPACLPFSSDPFYKVQNCKIKALALGKFIVKNPNIGTYVIAGNFGFLESAEFLQNSENNRFTNVRVSGEVSNSDKATYIENYSRFFEVLLKWNKTVILVRDIPSLGVNPQSCLALHPSYLSKLRLSPLQDNSVVRKDSSDCWIDSKSFIERDKYNRLSVDEMLKKFPEVYSFDSVPLICSVPHKCFIVRKGVPLYFNSDHLSIDGADLIMTEFVKLFKINLIKPD